MNNAFLLIDILWKIMINYEKKYPVFKYIFEVVVNQLFEEYIFIKTVLKRLETIFIEKKEESWIVDFLYFYDHFIWKNKKFTEMYDKYNWYFKNNLIRFPSIYFMEETVNKILNEKLIEYREKIDKRKHYITTKQSYKQLSELSKTYMEELSNTNSIGEKDLLLFSKKSILNKLEIDIIQKKEFTQEKQFTNATQNSYLD